jgi:regulator of protease activity HflC (stomatin/prohibitin superfamily)
MPDSDDFERAFAENEPPNSGRSPQAPPIGRIALLVGVGALALLLMTAFAAGEGGIVDVQAEQVAVIANYLNGTTEVVLQPGYKFFVPFLQKAFLFDKSMQAFLMQGEVDVDSNHVKKLTVRANDGSNLWFDDVTIQYRLIPSMADVILRDSGPGNAYKDNWVRAYARSILRDEFGKFSSAEIADPTNYDDAALASRDRLNEVLRKHGIDIDLVKTPKPKFDTKYEKAIEDRKVANQEVERIKARADQLRRERERLLAEIDSTKAVEFESLKGSLNADFLVAERERVRVERSADAYKTRMLGEGASEQVKLSEQARGMREKAIKEAEGLKAKAEALATQGEVLVRERLAQRLKDIEFTLVPYTKDASPTRVELEAAGSMSANVGGNR